MEDKEKILEGIFRTASETGVVPAKIALGVSLARTIGTHLSEQSVLNPGVPHDYVNCATCITIHNDAVSLHPSIGEIVEKMAKEFSSKIEPMKTKKSRWSAKGLTRLIVDCAIRSKTSHSIVSCPDCTDRLALEAKKSGRSAQAVEAAVMEILKPFEAQPLQAIRRALALKSEIKPRVYKQGDKLVVGRVTLKIEDENSNRSGYDYIPQNANPYLDTEQNSALEEVALGAEHNLPTLLIGETGTGKTSLVRFLAQEVRQPFRRLNLNGSTGVEEFIGKLLLNEKGTFWVDGVLVDALKKGYWLLLDEINAALPEILFVLHSLLDDDGFVVLAENNGEIVRPHPNFRLFASMNPTGEYAGTKELNKALLSRFPIVVKVGYPSPETEKKILISREKVEEDVAKRLVSIAGSLRTAKAKNETTFVCSTRELLSCVKLYKALNSLEEAVQVAILNKVVDEERPAIRDVIGVVLGQDWWKKF